MSKIIEQIEKNQMSKEIPSFSPGDTVVVQVKVKEANRERLQAYEGLVIAKKNRGLNSSFTALTVFVVAFWLRLKSNGAFAPIGGFDAGILNMGR